MTATVGLAFGRQSDVTSEAARVVIVDSSLSKVDEIMHVSYRLRRIALQSALGGMALSLAGMCVAAAGLLPPIAGAVTHEFIKLYLLGPPVHPEGRIGEQVVEVLARELVVG